MRGNSKELYETNDRAENNAADDSPRRASDHQVDEPAEEKHKDDRPKKRDAGGPCEAGAADRFVGRLGNVTGKYEWLFARLSSGPRFAFGGRIVIVE